MDWQLIYFFAVVIFSIISFAREWFAIEVTALLVLAALLIGGLIDEKEAISGFANPAVVTIAAMFILSHAFARTGLVRVLTIWLENNGQGRSWVTILLFLLAVSIFSAFINNTATVAILIPVSIQLARRLRMSPSKLLIPLSYASIVGGTCTLIGTSTNLVVNELAQEQGVQMGIFELARLGLVMVLVTLFYSLAAQRWLLPSRLPVEGLTKKYHLSTYLTEVRVTEESNLLGKTLMDAGLATGYQVTVLEILRSGTRITHNIRQITYEAEDVLIIQCPMETLRRFRDEQKVLLLTDVKMNDSELSDTENALVEIMISPNSRLVGHTLQSVDFRQRYGVFVLAVRRLEELMRQKIAHVIFKKVDTLLVFGARTRLSALKSDPDFIVLDELDMQIHKLRFWWVAVLLIPIIVVLAALNLISILTGALLGAILVITLGIVQPQEAYKVINWTVIFLIAAFIPIEHAMDAVGLSTRLGDLFVKIHGTIGINGLLAVLILITMLTTSFLSNNATAIIMTPLAIEMAVRTGSHLEPFLMAVMFAASLAFITPNGYQTNTMVFSAGGYRYVDFLRAGLPLQIILYGLAVVLIPLFWPI